MERVISYEAKIEFMEEAKKSFVHNEEPSAVMMCTIIIEDLARLRDLEK